MIGLDDQICDAGDLGQCIADAAGRLMMLFVTESMPGRRELSAIIGADDSTIRGRSQLGAESYPSLTPRVPAAHWFERQIHDLWGNRSRRAPRS